MGVCNTDALIVTGGASNVPILCGENTGQHIYVDFNGNTSITISIRSSGLFASRAWNIKVSQIACNCPYRAPSGCLQFYNTTTGTVTSFNYGSVAPQNGARQLVNMNYGICVATIRGFCGIQWAQTAGTMTFTVSDNTYTFIGDGTIGTAAAQQTGAACTADFVVVPGPILPDGTALTSDRFCGNAFVTLQTFSQPFVMTVVTNGDETGDMGNAGFSMTFTQLSCGMNIFVG
nr:uncharacterized protein LOC111504950 [Leptinotarsa decemlineata]